MTQPPKPLTAKQRRLLAALRDHIVEHGDRPTAQQLARAAGMKSPDAARTQLGQLLLDGYIRDDPTQPGGLLITIPPGEGGSES